MFKISHHQPGRFRYCYATGVIKKASIGIHWYSTNEFPCLLIAWIMDISIIIYKYYLRLDFDQGLRPVRSLENKTTTKQNPSSQKVIRKILWMFLLKASKQEQTNK